MHFKLGARYFFLVAGLLGAGRAGAQTAQPPDPDFVAALSAARARGCAGKPGVSAPLRWPGALSAAAARIAQGAPPGEALAAAGYRAVRMFQMTLRGPGSAAAAARMLAQRYCEPLSQAGLKEAGMHHEGNGFWVVLAEPFDPPAASEAREIAVRALALVNGLRASPRRCGEHQFEAAPPLRLSDRLEQAASIHARDMAAHSYMAHEGRDGSTFAQRITRAGYRWRAAGENVAAGQATAERVVNDWAGSPGHCANLMNPAFTEMGLAYAVNSRSAQGIYWAQTLARPTPGS